MSKKSDRDKRLAEQRGERRGERKALAKLEEHLGHSEAQDLLTSVRTELSISSGPVPTPDVLQAYENLVPGTALRILNWAEEQAKHRRSLEKTVIEGDISRSKNGVLYGLIVSVIAILGGVYAMTQGHPIPGTILSCGSVVSLATVFVYGTASRRRERNEKATTLANRRHR